MILLSFLSSYIKHLSLPILPYLSTSTFFLAPKMGRPRKDFLALAKEKGASGVPTFVTGKRRLKKLEKCVEDRYEKIMEDWDR